jgi:hypothetical protein
LPHSHRSRPCTIGCTGPPGADAINTAPAPATTSDKPENHEDYELQLEYVLGWLGPGQCPRADCTALYRGTSRRHETASSRERGREAPSEWVLATPTAETHLRRVTAGCRAKMGG